MSDFIVRLVGVNDRNRRIQSQIGNRTTGIKDLFILLFCFVLP